ncbi:MAG TPA: S8 family serine peptidase [Azospirillum sp.]
MSPSKTGNRRTSVNPLTLPDVQLALLAGRPVEKGWRHRVNDLTPLTELRGLRFLDLSGTGVTDVSALSGLSKLQGLKLGHTKVTDVSALSGLSRLQTLILSNTGVTDVSALSGLSGLKALDLRGTGVMDVSALSGLSGLQWLDLSGTGVTDVSVLSGLSALRTLYLRGTGVTDVSALAHLTDLKIMGFDERRPSSASPAPEAPLRAPASAVAAAEGGASGRGSRASSMSDRVKLVFEGDRWLQRALATETPGLDRRVVSRRRSFIAVQRPANMAEDQFLAMVERLAKRTGARATPDFRYSLESRPRFSPTHTLPLDGADAGGSLDDVLRLIGIDWGLHNRSLGQGVSIAVVDTGVNGNRAEFPNRKGGWAPSGEVAWTDEDGHGTMCATIAAAGGGGFRGVAPGADLIACKTWFYNSELAEIYDALTDRARAGEVIVASNSFGIPEGDPPDLSVDYDVFHGALVDAIGAGVRVVFSAGNYHGLAGGTADSCGPNSVWQEKGRADVLSVATCDLEKAMWDYSSRGPGQFYSVEPDKRPDPFQDAHGVGRKPDVTAPTPRNGRILFGDEIVVMPDGWGTSGAAPQVAGLLALLLSRWPDLRRDELFDVVRSTAQDLDFAYECQGAGMIDCRKALDRAEAIRMAKRLETRAIG